jgi:hypothetical protein
VNEEFPNAVIIRPSIIYGEMDKFLASYANQLRFLFNSIALWNKGEKTVKMPVHVIIVYVRYAYRHFHGLHQVLSRLGSHKWKQTRPKLFHDKHLRNISYSETKRTDTGLKFDTHAECLFGPCTKCIDPKLFVLSFEIQAKRCCQWYYENCQ